VGAAALTGQAHAEWDRGDERHVAGNSMQCTLRVFCHLPSGHLSLLALGTLS
jgi:hypothetical protein